MTEPSQTRPRTRRGIKIVLSLSLAINLLILGAIGGAMLNGGPDGPIRDRVDLVRTLGLGPLGRALDRDDRNQIVARVGDDRALPVGQLATVEQPLVEVTDEAGHDHVLGPLCRRREPPRPGGRAGLAYIIPSSRRATSDIREASQGGSNTSWTVTCSTAGQLEWDLTPVFDRSYFLVVPHTTPVEGSYGRTSAGVERPPAAVACKPQNAATCP